MKRRDFIKGLTVLAGGIALGITPLAENVIAEDVELQITFEQAICNAWADLQARQEAEVIYGAGYRYE